ncbi:PLP-dependent transferase [Mycena sanguinolenta]|uniref:PLP-dependent transferase n=1 Tax=Mycena sanguinolenta TaxID=230812 RepID=A0A8H6XG75_9AGAR|nr:PLP-dependent transferase [Mycena sanguinolenta]
MSLLFKNLRIHQIFGANTDVGKTILTTALVRASATLKNEVFYLKPISTGAIQDADDEHVMRHSSTFKDRIHAHCLYRFHVPVSPHLAAQLAAGDESQKIVSDNTFINSISSYVQRCASSANGPAHMYVETAGGVHSPTLSGVTQLDCYRPLFLPTILIGDSRLGGISATISAYESLLLRGYIVDAILLFREDYYRNSEFLTPYFAERGIKVTAIDAPPPKASDASENFASTERYYESLDILPTVLDLNTRHTQRLAELASMPRRSLDAFWWPFVQHGLVKGEKDVTVIDSASSDFFSVYDAQTPPEISSLKPQLDGSASWWTQAFGHAHPALTLAAARASGRYGHVMFPQATHAPALQLAERLLDGPGKGWASRVFFSDDGSTGMEIALKMALRAFSVREGLGGKERKNLGVLGLKGSYHGDTIGAMDACAEEGVYTCEWHNAKGYWLDPPTISIQQGRPVITLPPALATSEALFEPAESDSESWVYDVTGRMGTPLAEIYHGYISRTLEGLKSARGVPRLAALVLEPLVMGAGGMIFVDPLFQRVLVDVVRERDPASPDTPGSWRGLPVIYDEVFVGLYRLGMQSTIPLLGAAPDISVNAKILTGGLVPLAATLASDSIFRAFYSTEKAEALLHGHSYTAHALGCEVANETMSLIEKEARSEAWLAAQARWEAPSTPSSVWSFWDPDFVRAVSHLDTVAEVMALGTVLSIKVKDSQGGYVSHSAQTLLHSIKECSDGSLPSEAPQFSVHFRTLGNVAYFMTSLNTAPETIRLLENKIWNALGTDTSNKT